MNITLDTMSKVYKAGQSSIDTMQLKGYELIKELFVDSSGFGADDEPALSVNQFETELSDLLKQYGSLTAKVTGVGQFQVYIGLFRKTGPNKAKKIANNTLLITDDDGTKRIRLHQTDILTERDGVVTLNTGGWDTLTTRERLNRYLTNHSVIRDRGRSYVVTGKGWSKDNRIEFEDGMTIKDTLDLSPRGAYGRKAWPATGV